MDKRRLQGANIALSDVIGQYYPDVAIKDLGNIESLVVKHIVANLYPSIKIGEVLETQEYKAIIIPLLGTPHSVAKNSELLLVYPLATWTVEDVDTYAELNNIERPVSETHLENQELGLEEDEFEILRNHFRGLGY